MDTLIDGTASYQAKGILALILSGVLFSAIGVFVKLIGPSVSPLLLITVRMISASLLIFILLSITGKIQVLKLDKDDMKFPLIAGVFGFALGMAFYIKSLTLVPVANAIFLHYVAFPLSTALFSILLLREQITIDTMAALALTFVGVYFIYGYKFSVHTYLLGNTLAFLSGICVSIFTVLMKGMGRKYDFYNMIFWPLLIGGLCLLPFSFTERLIFSLCRETILYLVGLVFISTFSAYILYALGLKRVQAHIVPVIMLLTEPLCAILLAWVVLGEPLPQYVALGGLLIMMSNLIIGLRIALRSLKGGKNERIMSKTDLDGS